ncbi:cilia- and flagella-associated protein 206-like [Vicugna pacos]|uniref:Cilia- and flagella-associated protein 206 n=1 Tax=Vicugna pacos TaxID=30538 RepID=A0ABM5DNH7_VICPA
MGTTTPRRQRCAPRFRFLSRPGVVVYKWTPWNRVLRRCQQRLGGGGLPSIWVFSFSVSEAAPGVLRCARARRGRASVPRRAVGEPWLPQESDIITCAREVEMMIKQLGAQLEQLKMTVKSKTAVPTSQVFPIFIALSNVWTSFQDETVLISILSNLMTHLEPFLGAHELFFPEKVMQDLLDGVTVKTDMYRMKEHIEDRVNLADFRKLEWLFPETTANFDKLLIQYRGFCPYTFATTDGLLLPGNPAIGILKYKEKYYTFNTRDAAYSFAENPENYIDIIREKAKKNAELIQLLELHQQFETLIPCSQMKDVNKHYTKPITKCESSTQTDTHLLPPTIVRSYEWNEWELRRQAIKLANLRQKVTHSVQTDLSHMRRENCSQVYPSKDASTQSMTEGSSRVPRPQIYIAGLRGGKSKTTHGVKVNLTRAVDET